MTSVPVLGNGDIWSAEDALRMVAETGCDGVVVGRGCLGRPWLFTDLAAAFAGSAARVGPRWARSRTPCGGTRHTSSTFDGDEDRACRDIRKHIAWYLKGFPAGSTVRAQLALVDRLLRSTTCWPPRPRRAVARDAAEGQRGRAGHRRSGSPCPRAGWTRASSTRPSGARSPRPSSTVSGG